MKTDGNAFGYDIKREGIVVGTDKLFRKGHTVGFMFAFDEGKLNTYRANAESDDFNFGLYHSKKFRDNRLEWKNYLGMGIQDYRMFRHMELELQEEFCDQGHDPTHTHDDDFYSGTMASQFHGYTLSSSTELARPFYFGECGRFAVRPYLALDVAGAWQNGASETGDLYDAQHNDKNFLVALDYKKATDIRVFGRQGITFVRDGLRGYLRGGISHSYLLGGRPYTSVNNQFQFRRDATQPFNIHGASNGNSIVSVNCGMGAYFGKYANGTVWIDYTTSSGIRSAAHTLQIGVQRKF